MLTRLFALLLAFATLAPSGVLASVLYLCHMDGKYQSEQCCPKKKQKHSELPQLTQRECCEKLVTELDQLPGTLNPSISLEHMAAVSELPVGALPVALEARRVPDPGHGDPPPIGPPVYVKVCSFLI